MEITIGYDDGVILKPTKDGVFFEIYGNGFLSHQEADEMKQKILLLRVLSDFRYQKPKFEKTEEYKSFVTRMNKALGLSEQSQKYIKEVIENGD